MRQQEMQVHPGKDLGRCEPLREGSCLGLHLQLVQSHASNLLVKEKPAQGHGEEGVNHEWTLRNLGRRSFKSRQQEVQRTGKTWASSGSGQTSGVTVTPGSSFL